MSSEGWCNSNGEEQYSGRNFSNSNYRGGQRREGGGYQGFRQSYGGSGGYGNQRTGGGGGYGQNGGGRQYYGQDRQPRQNFNGQPRVGGAGGGTFRNFPQNGTSSIIEIEPNKVGMVIGRGGGKIREIQENFNVHVKIDRDPGVNGLTGVTIRGEEASIQQAKDFIQDLVTVK